MLSKLTSFIKKPTSKHIIINTLGNYLNVFFTAFFALILVRILNPTQYGVLSVLLGIAYVLANVLDFGTTATIYSYLPPLIENKAVNIYRFIKTNFYYQSCFSFIIIIVLFISFPTLDKIFFRTGAPSWELYLTAFSVLFFIWQNFALNCLYAAKKFLKANIYLNIQNVLKTIVIFLLSVTHNVSVGSVIFVFGILGPVIFFLFIFIQKKDLVIILLKAKITKEEFRIGYTLTYFLATQFYNLGLRMDLFLLSFFRPKDEVGFYGLSQKIILTIITTQISITQVLSPGFSKITNVTDIKSKFKNGFMYLLIPSALFLALFFTPNQIFYLFFTEKFAQTASITRALALPFIIMCLGSLLSLFILYTVKKPVYMLVTNIVMFLIISIGCYLYVPTYGVIAPRYVLAVAFTVGTIILSLAAAYEYRKLKFSTALSTPGVERSAKLL